MFLEKNYLKNWNQLYATDCINKSPYIGDQSMQIWWLDSTYFLRKKKFLKIWLSKITKIRYFWLVFTMQIYRWKYKIGRKCVCLHRFKWYPKPTYDIRANKQYTRFFILTKTWSIDWMLSYHISSPYKVFDLLALANMSAENISGFRGWV